jgi:hypothetical protein
MKLYHFDRMIKEASQSLHLGVSVMGEKWVREFVERGENWDHVLEDILSDQTSDVRSDYYERFFFKTNKENADFLMRISYRLS